MKTYTSILGVIAALTVATSAVAQQPTVKSEAAGLLGKRYAEASFGFVDSAGRASNAFGTGFDVNLPIAAALDVGAGLSYAWAEGNRSLDATSANINATAFFTQGEIKHFVTASVGYTWTDGNNDPVWSAGTGVEYNVNAKLSFQLSATFDGDFEKGTAGLWDGTLSAHYLVTERIGARLSASLIEGGNVGYGLGLVYKF